MAVNPIPPIEMPPRPARLLTVKEYLDMHRLGILTADDRVELLEGWLVEKMGKNPPHLRCADRLLQLLFSILPEGYFLRQEAPITFGRSVPEPDFTILRGERDDYAKRLPSASDAAVVMEISDTTLAKDRKYKTELYSRAGIPVFWLVNLNERQIEVYSDPDTATSTYLTTVILGEEEVITLVVDGDEVTLIPVKDILP